MFNKSQISRYQSYIKSQIKDDSGIDSIIL